VNDALSTEAVAEPRAVARRRIDLWAAQFGVAVINLTAGWPAWARLGLARVLGDLGWALAASRRRVTLANLTACFPELDQAARRQLGRRVFRNLARATVDHSVLWKGSLQQIERMVRIVTIYARQSNPIWDRWLAHGRSRFIPPVLIARRGADLRAAVRAIREGLPFYYLPDIDGGDANSIFVPFMGVPTATLPMVSRLARMTGARVMMTVTEQTEEGYVMHLEPPWEDFPGPSVEHDTERMNREIERWVRRLPDQYLWTHRRFKTRPAGQASFY
jgi:KDO2-lipid IV(A) lauroyltransferase